MNAAVRPARQIIGPQPGPQTVFSACSADIALFGGSGGGGKALKLDTPIPTPTGWTTIGELVEGDQVFDETGVVCRVVQAHHVIQEPESFRLTFDDGSTLDACADHQWATLTAKDMDQITRIETGWADRRREARASRSVSGSSAKSWLAERNAARAAAARASAPPKPLPVATVKSTREIAATVLAPCTRPRTNHAIAVAGALDLPHAPLPLDPYVLGVWLGDGNRNGGHVTFDDPPILNEISKAGFEVRKVPSTDYGTRIVGLTTILRSMGFVTGRGNGDLGVKFVPTIYLRASREQRLALLHGLMDTDGCLKNEGGNLEFDTTSPAIRDGMDDLLAGLGIKFHRCDRRAILNGKDCGPSWRFHFTTATPAFRLPRKLAGQNLTPRRTTRYRYIVKCEPIPSTPMRCITVDSASSLYLAGRAMVPTHNTRALVDECAKWVGVPGFGAVMFRRTFPDIRRPGGLKDATQEVYPLFGGKLREDYMTWTFPAKSTVQLAHLQHEKDIYDWKGSEVALFCVAEGTPVLMGDGTYLPIESLVAGDRVMTLEGPKRVTRTFAPRLKPCVRADVIGDDGSIMASQEHPEDHAILTDEGWRAYSREGHARPHEAREPTQCRSPRISVSRPETRSLPSSPERGTLSPGWRLQCAPSRSSQDLSDCMEFDACSEDAANDSEACCGCIQAPPLPQALSVLARLHGPHPQSPGRSLHRDPRGRVEPCVPSGSPSIEGFPDRSCSSCRDRGDGPLPLRSGSDRSDLRQEASADGCSPSCRLEGGPEDTRTRSRGSCTGTYVHPYTMEDRTASEASGFRACVMIPVGERRVYDLSVEGANHYVTAGGFVNKNCFDELTSFTRTQFFYMLSRNRSKCGVRPYIRASTNPDAESWVAELVAWWWDPQTGLAIPERSGVIRWFIQDPKGGGLIWADTREELLEQDKDAEPLSFTFIRSKLEDNAILMDRDPAYRSRLKALDPVERSRLLDGNWLTKPAPGLYFQLDWCPIVYADEMPAHIDWCRGWDRAATPKTPENDPDWTVGVRIGKDAFGNFYVEDAVRMRASSMHVEQAIINTARIDDASHQIPTRVQLAQDPAQAGKGEAEHMVRALAGHDVHAQLEGGDKLTRFKAFSAQAENGNVKIVLQRDPAGNAWIKPWSSCLEQFPPDKGKGHDDDVDATSTAFNALLTMPSVAMLMRMGGG